MNLGLVCDLPAYIKYREQSDGSVSVIVSSDTHRYARCLKLSTYEKRKLGTFHMPGRNTVYPPTNTIMKVATRPMYAAYGMNQAR